MLGAALFAQEPAEITNGYGPLVLGMGMDEAKAALTADPVFLYRESDVSLVPSSGRPVIETRGTAFVERAVLQFDDDRLYVLTLLLDKSRMDYFSVFSEFAARYGEPVELDPGIAVWQSETIRLSLERPLIVKYIDRAVFADIVASGAAIESLESLTREAFLDQL